jgi:glycine/D-amino acid oxidase-like deaminating enzyme
MRDNDPWDAERGRPARLPRSLWAHITPPAPATESAARDERVDVAVVGAGYTGLSSAIHLAQAGAKVAVIEAAEAGWGASGRNGGQVIPGLKVDPDDVLRMIGPERGERLISWAASAPDVVFDLIEKHRIPCNPVRNGWIQPAYTKASLKIITSRFEQWKKRGANVELLDPASLPEMLGTPKYVGAWIDMRGGSINPLAYSRGLARVALESGASLYTASPVRELARYGSRWRAVTPRATITADFAIVATGAYCGDLVPGLRKTFAAVRIGEVATKPIREEMLARILPGRQPVSDWRRLLASFRITPDGRLMMGGSTATSGPESLSIRESLHRTGRALFGHFGTLDWEYFWSGVFAVTTDKLPRLYEPQPNLIAALGCNGRGIALSTAFGKVLADRVSGKREDELVVPPSRFKPIPFHSLYPPSMPLIIRWKGLQDRIDRALS